MINERIEQKKNETIIKKVNQIRVINMYGRYKKYKRFLKIVKYKRFLKDKYLYMFHTICYHIIRNKCKNSNFSTHSCKSRKT